MGRPTTERKGKTVKVRVSDELYEEISKEGRNISEVIREYIREGLGKKPSKKVFVPQKTGIEKTEGYSNVPQNIIKESTYKELESMCRISGFSTERFFDRICELFKEGNIYVDGISIKTRGRYDTRGLEEICHRLNTDPQEMIDRLSKSLMRG